MAVIYLFGVFNESRNVLAPAELLEVLSATGDHHVDVRVVLYGQVEGLLVRQRKRDFFKDAINFLKVKTTQIKGKLFVLQCSLI